MEILQLKPEQLTRSILKLLNELSNTDKITLSTARLIVDRQIKANIHTYVIYESGMPVGIGSVIIAEKLIRNGSKAAFLEDIAIRKDCQGLGYGKALVKFLEDFAVRQGCYKIILCCAEHNIGFYQKVGYHIQDHSLRKNLRG
jgi:glucosamine-phosphate N-acetyltransferase